MKAYKRVASKAGLLEWSMGGMMVASWVDWMKTA
jgi:hypothetical protein